MQKLRSRKRVIQLINGYLLGRRHGRTLPVSKIKSKLYACGIICSCWQGGHRTTASVKLCIGFRGNFADTRVVIRAHQQPVDFRFAVKVGGDQGIELKNAARYGYLSVVYIEAVSGFIAQQIVIIFTREKK